MNDIKDLIELTEKKEDTKRKKGAFSYMSSLVAAPEGSVPGTSNTAPAKLWMTSDYLSEWMARNQLLEILYQPDTTHIELIRRSVPALRLLQMRGELTERHLDMLWNLSSTDKHESVVHLVYDIVGQMSSHLTAPLLKHMLNRISQKPYTEYDSMLLELVRTFTLNAFKVPEIRTETQYGVEACWNIAQMKAAPSMKRASQSLKTQRPLERQQQQLPMDVVNKATEYFMELISTESAAPQRQKYMEKCIANLQSARNVTQNLHLLQKLIQTYPQSTKSWFDRTRSAATQSAVIEDLNKKQMLLESVLAELAAFKSQVQRLSKDGNLDTSGLAFQQAVSARQSFLVFILSTSALQLTTSQMDALWDQFVTNAVSVRSRDGFFEWLIEACNESGEHTSLTDSLKEHVFNREICNLQPESLTKRGFQLLYRYLLYVDSKSGYIKVDATIQQPALLIGETNAASKQASSPAASNQAIATVADSNAAPATSVSTATVDEMVDEDDLKDQLFLLSPERKAAANELRHVGNEITVVNYNELKGIDLLWNVAFRAQRPIVGRYAIRLLNVLHHNLSPKLKDKQATIRDQYLRKCLNRLSQALATSQHNNLPNDVGTRRVISRCVYLLKTFLATFTESNTNDGITFNVTPDKDLRVDPFQLSLKQNQTIGDLRVQVGQRLTAVNAGMTLAMFSMTWDAKKLVSNHVQLSAVAFKNGDIVTVQRDMPPLRTFVSPTEEPVQPIPSDYPYSFHLHSTDRPTLTRKASNSLRKQSLTDPALNSIASDPQTFDRLFHLLQPGQAIANDSWEILALLPTNKAFLRRVIDVENMQQVSWGTVLDARSLYRLIYTLRIVDDIMHQRLSGEFASVDRTRWAAAFVQKGGLQYMAQLTIEPDLQTYDEHRHGPKTIHNTALELLFRLLHDFFAMDQTYPASAGSRMYDMQLPAGTLTRVQGFEYLCQALIVNAAVPAVVQAYMSTPAVDANSTDLTAAAFSLITDCVQLSPDIMQAFFTHPQLDEFLSVSLLQSRDADSRIVAADSLSTIWQIAQKSRNTNEWSLLRRLLVLLQDTNVAIYNHQSEQMFAFLIQLLHQQLQSHTQVTTDAHSELVQVANNMLDLLRNHQSTETYSSFIIYDQYLVGLLNVLRLFVKHSVMSDTDTLRDLMLYVYKQCLFETPTENSEGAKCKSYTSRTAAYALVVAVCSASADCFAHALSRLSADSTLLKERDSWSYQPVQLERDVRFRAGLKNQGATCYQNSFLQLLYSVDSFRFGLMKSRITVEQAQAIAAATPNNSISALQNAQVTPFISPNAVGRTLNKPRDARLASIVYQIQSMFAHLQLSQKHYYDTYDFNQSLRDWNGQPVNPNEQKDVNEFGSQLFNLLETELKDAQQAAFLSQSFRGLIMHQIISKECEHTVEREEPFYMISLTVKNKRTLQQSLDLFVTGDVLDGDNKYMCGSCGTKVDALKRSCFYQLPSHLILHLKRFEFDFDTMRKVKVNSYLEFPMEINVYNYTREGLHHLEHPNDTPQDVTHPADYYTYVLSGILVHSGQAEAGHYWSYSRSPDTDEWTEYNDTIVKPFDSKLIPQMCFGGVDVSETVDPKTKQTVKKETARIANAYMLIFDRKLQQPTRDGATTAQQNASPASRASIQQQDVNASPSRLPSMLPETPRRSFSNKPNLLINTGRDRLSDEEDEPHGVDVNQIIVSDASSGLSDSDGIDTDIDLDDAAALNKSISNRDNNLRIRNERLKRQHSRGSNGGSKLAQLATTLPPTHPIARGGRPQSDNFFAPNALMVPSTPLAQDSAFKLFSPSEPPDLNRQISNRSNNSALFAFATHTRQSSLGSVNGTQANGHRSKLSAPTSPEAQTIATYPPDILETILTANIDFLTDKNVFDFSYLTFMWNFLHIPNPQVACNNRPTSFLIAQAATLYTFKILVRSADNSSLPQWLHFLYQLYTNSKQARVWLLDMPVHDPIGFETMLFSCPYGIIREAFVDLIAYVISIHSRSQQERASYSVQHAIESKTSDGSAMRVQRHASPVTRLVQSMLELMPVVRRYWRSYMQFFRLLRKMAELNHEMRVYMINQGAISSLVSFYSDVDPLAHFNVRPGFGNEPPRRIHAPQCEDAMQTLSILIRSCTTDSVATTSKPSQVPLTAYSSLLTELGQFDRDSILAGIVFLSGSPKTLGGRGDSMQRSAFLPWLISDKSNSRSMLEIACYWSYENYAFSSKILEYCLKGLLAELSVTDMGGEYRHFFRLIMAVVTIPDTQAALRVEYVMPQLAQLINKVCPRRAVGDERFLMHAHKYLIQMALRCQPAMDWITQSQSEWKGWLERYKKSREQNTPNNNRS